MKEKSTMKRKERRSEIILISMGQVLEQQTKPWQESLEISMNPKEKPLLEHQYPEV